MRTSQCEIKVAVHRAKEGAFGGGDGEHCFAFEPTDGEREVVRKHDHRHDKTSVPFSVPDQYAGVAARSFGVPETQSHLG
jgi:hypothetical protein